LVESAEFSEGDRFIYECADGRSSGSPSIWRKINVVHHITRVVIDLAKERELEIPRKVARPRAEQASLFSID